MTTLMVGAFAEEMVALADVGPWLVTGPGKVNAAVGLAAELGSGRYDAVLNLGTAGRLHQGVPVWEPIEVGRLVEWDSDLPTLGAALYGDRDRWSTSMTLGPQPVLLASGDSFVQHGTEAYERLAGLGADLVDMEAWAYATVCARFGVPFRSVKVVSDDGDLVEWTAAVSRCADVLGGWAAEHL